MPATHEMIVSIVSPVVSGNGTEITGLFGFDVYLDTLKQTLSDIKVGEAGYLELISNSSDYIYSDDPTASGKNVSEIKISDDYKNKVKNNYNGFAGLSDVDGDGGRSLGLPLTCLHCVGEKVAQYGAEVYLRHRKALRQGNG